MRKCYLNLVKLVLVVGAMCLYVVDNMAQNTISENLESWSPLQVTNSCQTSTQGADGNGWIQDPSDGGEWRLDKGGTPSSGTGPSNDHNPGNSNGRYLYTESSSCYNSTVSLLSPVVDLSYPGNHSLAFAYHMYGSNMGSLHVDILQGSTWTNSVWSKSGAQGNSWKVDTIDLSGFNSSVTQIRFRGVTGGSYRSDMAIDNMTITYFTAPPLPNDASVEGFWPDVVCPGPGNIYAIVANNGTNQINSLTLDWSIDGISQSTVSYTGTIDTLTQDTILLGSYNFSGVDFDLDIATSSPNGQTDPYSFNDSLFVQDIPLSMTGTYTIGSSGVFTDFTSAANALIAAGVCGPVVFEAAPGTYSEKISIPEIVGASATNTITFQSQGMDSTTVIITAAGSSSANYLFELTGADYIHIKGLQFQPTNNTYSNAVVLKDGSEHIEITNNKFVSPGIGTSNNQALIRDEDAASSDIEVAYNSFYNGSMAMVIKGSTSSSIYGVNVHHNIIDEFRSHAMYLQYLNSPVIAYNSCVSSVNSTSATKNGITLKNATDSIRIHSNRIVLDQNKHSNGLKLSTLTSTQNAKGLIYNNFISILGGTNNNYGIRIDGSASSYLRLLHNSVYVYGNNNNETRGINPSAGSNIEVYNNNVKCKRYPTLYEGNAVVASDYNNLYSMDNIYGYYQGGWNNYTSLADLVTALVATNGFDTYSISVDPMFVSNSDLHVLSSSVALNGHGIPLPDVLIDIDGDPRDAVDPDMGADEFDVVGNDAGVTAIVGMDGLCPGSSDIYASVFNFGTQDITSITIDWSLNGTAQSTVVSNDTISSAASIDVLLGSYTFQTGVSYDVSAWSSLPNNTADANVANDSAQVTGVETGLSGSYTVGTGGDYADLANVVTALSNNGICNAVVFNLLPGTFTEQFEITPIAGATNINTVTFKGQGNSSIISYSPVPSNRPIINVDGANHIVFDSIYFHVQGAYGWGINFMNQADSNTVQNCYFEMPVNTGSSNRGVCALSQVSASSTAGNNTNYLKVLNNTFTGGWISINFDGSNSNLIGNEISYNTVSEFSFRGIGISGNSECNIIGNELSSTQANAQRGIRSWPTGPNFNVLKNKVYIASHTAHTRLYEIANAPGGGSASGTVLIANNMALYAGTYTSNACGIYVKNTSYMNIYNNTTHVASGNGSKSIWLDATGTTTNVELKNNNISSMVSGAELLRKHNSVTCVSSNNNFYNPTGFKNFWTANQASLADFQTASGDVGSISVDPMFVSATDLHIQISNAAMNNLGTPLASVTTDIDGDLRDPLAPDMGADEYTPLANDATIAEVYSMGQLPLNGSGDHIVQAVVRNLGIADQTNLQVTLSVSGVNTLTDTYTIPLLTPGSSELVSFTSFVPATLGWNNIVVSVPNDEDNTNNSNEYSQEISNDTHSYADTFPADGYGGITNAMVLNKYYVDGIRNITDVEVYLSASAIGNTYHCVVMDAGLNILASSNPYTPASGDENTYVGFTIPNPAQTVLANDYFYVGFVNTGTANPVGYQTEDPLRSDAFYSADLSGGGLTAYTNTKRWMIKAVTGTPDPFDAAVVGSASPASGCGLGLETIIVDVLNNGSDTITALDLSYLVAGATVVSESVITTLLPGDLFTYSFAAQFDFSVIGVNSTFDLELWVTLANDTLAYNDTLAFTLESNFIPDAPLVYDETVLYGNSATLTLASPYMVSWYDDINGTNLINNDTFYVTPQLFDTTTYYVASSSASPANVLIGSGTQELHTIPVYGYNNYSWASMIYTASEMGNQPMLISSIKFEVVQASNFTMNNQKFYFGHTGAAGFGSNLGQSDISAMDLVFEGTIIWNAGWFELVLDNPFFYNGMDNLEIYAENHDGSGAGSIPKFKSDYVSGRSKHKYSNTLTAVFPLSTGTASDKLPNIEFIGSAPGCESALVPITAYVTNIPDWNAGVVSYTSPVSGIELTQVDVCVEIENIGAQTIFNFPVSYDLSGSNVMSVTEVYTGSPIAPGGTAQYCFSVPADVANYGAYTLCVYTGLTGDSWSANDTLCWQFDNDPLSYCMNSYSTSSWEEITQVSIGAFVNSSAPPSNPHYSDFTGLGPIMLSNGLSYPIEIQTQLSPGYSGSYSCFLEVYADWNHDGVWDESTDELIFGSQASSTSTKSGTFTVPLNAAPGIHRLRVVFEETGSGVNVHPCGTYSYGETEDYLIQVQEPSDHDAGVTAFILPVQTPTLTENDLSPVQVIVQNFGLLPITTMDVVLSVDGIITQTNTYTGNLASFESDTVDFTDMLIPGRYFDICAHTVLALDTITANDTTCQQLYALPQFDLEMTSIDAPATGCDLGMEDVVITLTNLGDTIPGGVNVAYFTNAMTVPVVESITDTIFQGGTYTYTFNNQVDLTSLTTTDFLITAYCNYAPDPIAGNDTSSVLITAGVSPSGVSANDALIWSGQSTTLSVNSPDTSLIYSWYNADTILLMVDTTLTTPPLFDTTTYYLSASTGTGATIGISEICVGGIDYVEITNFSNGQIDATGWVVAVSNSYTNINSINNTVWQLGAFQAGEIKYKTDSSNDNYWGSNLFWSNGSSSSYKAWVAIIDDMGNLVDLWSQGWSETQLATFTGTINGFQVDFTSGWSGPGINVTSSYSQRSYYDTDAASDWVNTLSGTKGQAYSGLVMSSSTGTSCASALQPVTVYIQYADYDGALASVLSPTSWCYLGNESVTVEIYNNGLNPIHNFGVYFQIGTQSPVNETITDTIQPGASLTYTFAALADLTAFGNYNMCFGVNVANDGFTSNDEICQVVENWNGCGFSCTDAFPYGMINDPSVLSATTFSGDFEWWKFDVPVAYENVVVSLCGSTFNTKLDFWNSCSASGAAYTNNNSCGNQSQISIPGILMPGTYFVKVYGNSSAFGDFALEITGTQVPKFIIDLTGTDILCNGEATGSVVAGILPGNGGSTATYPVTFDWGPSLPAVSNLNNLPSGTYSITVTDFDGWVETETITLTEPDALILSASITDATGFGLANGAIDASVVGGISPYAYYWSNNEITEDLINLYASVYRLSVTDDNNCQVDESFSVVSPIPSNTWIPTVTNVVHNIVVPMNAYLTLDNSPVSPGSIIGVFYNQGGSYVCGGYAFWSGLETEITAYGTSPNLNNGFAPNETFVWKIWDVSQTDAYGGSASYSASYPNGDQFVVGGLSGVESLTFQTIITQTINLPSGWSIWSTYIDPVNPSIDVVMSDIVSPAYTYGLVEIVKNGAGNIFWPFYGLNLINNVVVGEGYQVKINGTSPVSFGVTGLQFIPELTSFNIPSGWSILGYLRMVPGDMASMLSSISAPIYTSGTLEIAKNGDGQIYWPFYGLNTIGNMMPGEGYQVKMNNAAPGFSYPANNQISKTIIIKVDNFYFKMVDPTGNNMTIGIPADAWNVPPLKGDEIAVFGNDDVLMGTAVYNDGFVGISVWGDEILSAKDKGSTGERFCLKLWNQEKDIIEELVVEEWKCGKDEFCTNSIAIVTKVQRENDAAAYTLGQNIPNPFSDKTIIPFSIPRDDKVNISIYNTLGELIQVIVSENLSAGYNEIEFDASQLEAGTYFYKIISNEFHYSKAMLLE
jgi:hypothetical protein